MLLIKSQNFVTSDIWFSKCLFLFFFIQCVCDAVCAYETVWECVLPLGCQSGRSVWRCCSQCKSTEKETQRFTLGLPIAQMRVAWNHLTDTSCDRPVRRVQAQKQIWKPHKWVSTATPLFCDWHHQMSLGWRCKTIRSNTDVSTDSFTLTSSYSLLLSACRIIDLEASVTMKKIKIHPNLIHNGVIVWYVEKWTYTFCLRGRLSENSSVCPHTPQP